MFANKRKKKDDKRSGRVMSKVRGSLVSRRKSEKTGTKRIELDSPLEKREKPLQRKKESGALFDQKPFRRRKVIKRTSRATRILSLMGGEGEEKGEMNDRPPSRFETGGEGAPGLLGSLSENGD